MVKPKQWVHYHMGDLQQVIGRAELERSPSIADALKVPDAVYPVRLLPCHTLEPQLGACSRPLRDSIELMMLSNDVTTRHGAIRHLPIRYRCETPSS